MWRKRLLKCIVSWSALELQSLMGLSNKRLKIKETTSCVHILWKFSRLYSMKINLCGSLIVCCLLSSKPLPHQVLATVFFWACWSRNSNSKFVPHWNRWLSFNEQINFFIEKKDSHHFEDLSLFQFAINYTDSISLRFDNCKSWHVNQTDNQGLGKRNWFFSW